MQILKQTTPQTSRSHHTEQTPTPRGLCVSVYIYVCVCIPYSYTSGPCGMGRRMVRLTQWSLCQCKHLHLGSVGFLYKLCCTCYVPWSLLLFMLLIGTANWYFPSLIPSSFSASCSPTFPVHHSFYFLSLNRTHFI